MIFLSSFDDFNFSNVDHFFPIRLQKIMDERGVSAKDLEDTGIISASSIKSYVDGEVVPNLRTLCRVAEFLNVSIDWLCGVNEEANFDFLEQRKAPWL